MDMTIIKNYQADAALRASFNALAEATFGLSFENWYRLGYWGSNYTPYSVFEDGKIVANVSVNRTDMMIGGQRKRLYQLGTVMTDPEYRNRGYIRAVMAEVEKVVKKRANPTSSPLSSRANMTSAFFFSKSSSRIISSVATTRSLIFSYSASSFIKKRILPASDSVANLKFI